MYRLSGFPYTDCSMSTLESIPNIESIISRWIIQERKSFSYVSEQLKSMYPTLRGTSVRSIKRFCSAHDIYVRSGLTDYQVDIVVKNAVCKVGPSYGRKTITGLLASDGVRIGEKRVGRALERVSIQYHNRRRVFAHHQTNPVPYTAEYFGQKLHIDQNEKMVMFGCTHVCAVDGRSGMIVGFATMVIKNNVLIYDDFFKKILAEHGIWDQLRVDQGREWHLMLSVQQSLSHLRRNNSKPPFVQTTSKKNHMVERLWLEENTRVNYPIKAVLIQMLENNDFDLDSNLHYYCVSWITRKVANAGLILFIRAWNHHPIPGRNTQKSHAPVIEMSVNNKVAKVNPTVIPTCQQAVYEYRQSGGRITDPDNTCIDPLLGDQRKIDIRESSFSQRFPSIDSIFHTIVNFDSTMFKEALKFYIDITYRLKHS